MAEETIRGSEDLKRAFAALTKKQRRYTDLWNYYDGDQPVVYTSKRLRDLFRGVDAKITENWCAVVIDAAADRINLTGLTVPDDEAGGAALHEIWQESELQLEADDVHEAALVTGEAFVIVWPDEAEGQPPQVFYNDPRLCHVFYDPENPRKKRFAAKWWVDDDDKRRVTLYYPDRLEYFVSTNKASNVSTAAALRPADPPNAPNPYDAIPVFHFRPERRIVKSDLVDVVPIQNGINKLLADMMVAAEFGAFKQRWIISGSDVTAIKNSPYENYLLPPSGDGEQATQVGQFDATELRNFLDAIDNMAGSLATITRTPKHYFVKTGGDPSGEALIAMEAPLVKKVQDHIDRFTPTWREVGAFLLKLRGQENVAERMVVPTWSRPETVQPRTQAEIREIDVRSGLPLEAALEREGWPREKIDAILELKAAEERAKRAGLADALLEMERRRDRGGED